MIFLVNPLHYALHHNVGWSLAKRFPFVQGRLSVPIARSEARGLADRAPIVLQQSGAAMVPVVLLKPEWCRTPLFDSQMGWLGPRPPLTLAYHPFQTIEDATQPGRQVLAVASDPDVVAAGQPNAFFDHLAQPLPLVRAVLRRLQRLHHERRQMSAAAAALQAAGLLSPLPLTDGRGRQLFHTLDTARFKAMKGEDLAGLGERPQDALMLAAVLDHARRRHLVEPGGLPVESPRPTVQKSAQPAARSSQFLVDDDMMMSFET